MEMNTYDVPPRARPAVAAPGYPWTPGPHPWIVSPHPWVLLPDDAAAGVPPAAAPLDDATRAAWDAAAAYGPAPAAYGWTPAAYPWAPAARPWVQAGYPWAPAARPWVQAGYPWAPAGYPYAPAARPWAPAAYPWAPAARPSARAARPWARAAYGPAPAAYRALMTAYPGLWPAQVMRAPVEYGWPRPGAFAWPPPGLRIGPEAEPMELAPPPVVGPDQPRPGGPLLRLGEPDRWEDWRGVPDSGTDAAPVPLSVGDRLLLFRKAPDGQVYVAEMDPAGAWGPWEAVPGARTPLRPAAAAPGQTVYLFFTAGDGTLQVAVRAGGAWRAPVAVAGQRTVSPPGALAMDGTVFAFVRGAGDLVHYSRLAPGAEAWSPWIAIPGLETDDQPIPTEYAGRLAVFIHGKEGHHWYNVLAAPDRWAGWLQVPRRDPSYTPPGAAVYGGFLWLFAQFPDFTIWFIAAEDGFDWRTWRTVPLARSRSAPAPVVHGGRLYLFIRNMDDAISYTIRRVLRGEVIPSPGAARA